MLKVATARLERAYKPYGNLSLSGAVVGLATSNGTTVQVPTSTLSPTPFSAAAAVGGKRSATAAAAAADCAPRHVTRGESMTIAKQAQKDQSANVDWLNATFPANDRHTPATFLALLSRMFKRPLVGVEGRGMFGFDRSMKIIAKVGSTQYPIGCIAFGGESQKGRWMLQLTGSGCKVVPSWSRLALLLKRLDARITRLDLAVDYLQGEYSVNDAVNMYQTGEFSCGGRNPSTSCAGDWLNNTGGRTLYIGKAVNGKMLRVYEKGIQMGDAESPWVRFECQLGNRDRVIPFEALTDRDTYLAGCYPALQRLLEVAATKIKTLCTEGSVSLAHLAFHLKRSYGKLLSVLSGQLSAPADDLIESLTVRGAPKRLSVAAAAGGLTWAQFSPTF